jgi:hypothetical protein
MHKIYLLLIFISFSYLVYSQNRGEIKELKKNNNVSQESTDTITFPRQYISEENVLVFAQEVFLDCPQYLTESHIEDYKKFAKRFVVYSVPVGLYPECSNLSELQAKNKCNPALKYNLDNFDPQTFNPFKYHLKTGLTSSQFFRVDGKPFIIEFKGIIKK